MTDTEVEIKKNIFNVDIKITMEDGSVAIGGMSLVSSCIHTVKHWILDRIEIPKPFRRRGFGRFILEMLKKERNGHPITVIPGHPDMKYGDIVAFYLSCGFVRSWSVGLLSFPEGEPLLKEPFETSTADTPVRTAVPERYRKSYTWDFKWPFVRLFQ